MPVSAFDDLIDPDEPRVPSRVDIWTPMRRELLEWFRREAPSLAPGYEGAVRMLGDADFPGRLHFIAHAVRDIADRLAFVLDGDLESNRVQYEQSLDRILSTWPFGAMSNDIVDADEQGDGPDTFVPVPKSVYLVLDDLMAAHRTRRKDPGPYTRLFRALIRENPTNSTISRRLVDSFKKERKWFMSCTHLRRESPDPVPESHLTQHFERFEKMLHSFVGRFFTTTRELDEILRKANETTD